MSLQANAVSSFIILASSIVFYAGAKSRIKKVQICNRSALEMEIFGELQKKSVGCGFFLGLIKLINAL